MPNTKERILTTALDLFNTYGLPKVTLRTIAKAMGISQGNLNYHFKKREEIIEALYFALVSRIDESMDNLSPAGVSLESLINLSRSVMESLYDYRFFMLDFVQIMKENETIKSHYQQLSSLREAQFKHFFAALKQEKIMREEELPDEYDLLYKRIQILGDFWISAAETENKQISKKTITRYQELITQTIYPYLTAKGKKAYLALIA